MGQLFLTQHLVEFYWAGYECLDGKIQITVLQTVAQFLALQNGLMHINNKFVYNKLLSRKKFFAQTVIYFLQRREDLLGLLRLKAIKVIKLRLFLVEVAAFRFDLDFLIESYMFYGILIFD